MTSSPPRAKATVALLVVAAVVVYLASPARSVSAQGSSAGTDQLYVHDSGSLYRASTDGTTTLVGSLSMAWNGGECPVEAINIDGMDTAADGTIYGYASCGAQRYWARLDPETAVITTVSGPLSIPFVGTSILDTASNDAIGLRTEFPAAGTPHGYRFRWNNRGEVYAIDALSPYREHLLADSPLLPVAWNSQLGARLHTPTNTFFAVTVDSVYGMVVDPVAPSNGSAFLLARYYGNWDISTDAVVAGIGGDGYFSIIDGTVLYRVKPTTPTAIAGPVPLQNLNFVVGTFLHRAPHGGVRIEPHELLTTTESGGTATFTAVLTNQPTADVTVGFTSSDTSEGTVSPSSATFTTSNWKTPQTITVTGVSDNDAANQAFSIVTTSTSADANYHNRGVLDVDVTNTNVNQPPSLTAGSPSVRQGSINANATLGTVSDFETAAGALTVSTVTVPADIAVGTITNSDGTITTPLSATCSAPIGNRTLTLRVTDGNSATTDQDVTVSVLANTAPTLGSYSPPAVAFNDSRIAWVTAAPADNGSIASVTATSGTFTGTLSANASTGTVTIGNAAPAGVHTITVTVTDNCGATFARTFDLTVNPEGSSAGTDQLYVIDQNKLYRAATDGTTTLVGDVTWSTCEASGIRHLGLDTAADGTIYGLFSCGPIHSTYSWARLDPETAVITTVTNISNLATLFGDPGPGLPGTTAGGLVLLRQFGSAGSPLGYRLRWVNSPRGELYAVDALSPYREHLVATGFFPASWEVGLGVALSRDASTLYPTTIESSYRLPLDPVSQMVKLHTATDFTTDAVTTPLDADEFMTVFDGSSFHRIKPTNPISKVGPVQMPGRDFVTQAFLHRAPHGGVRVEPHEQLTTTESGGTATFTAVLTNQPTASVTVSFTSSDATEGTVSPSSVTFTTANWKTPQTITVTGIADSDTANQAFSIVTAATSSDPNYNNRAVLDVDVTNTHVNQLPSLSPGSPSARQGSPAATATLGTAADLETAAGSLTVATVAVPSGVTVGTITNTNGSITAPLSATCSATTGNRTLTLRVTDGLGGTFDQDVTVSVLANTAPTLGTYGLASSILPGAGVTLTPSSPPLDNGSIESVVISSGTFTGSLSVSGSGGVTIANAAPAGVHTITVTVTDNCGATMQRTFELTVNTPPTLTAGSPSARQGSPETNATLGTVSDAETAAGSLSVATVTVPSGLTVGTITNTGGTVTAPVTATCSATTGNRTLTLRVTDGAGGTTDQDVTISVLANTAPTLGSYGLASSILPGSGVSAHASSPPGDNGSVDSVTVSSGTFTGTLSVDAGTGAVTIGNAAPSGVHTITVTATDNCGATMQRTFELTVNTPPTLTAGSPSARQGSPAAGAMLGTVNDAETAAGSLSVATVTVPSGLTVGTITNTGGTITAPLSATCSATLGARILTLRVTDGLGDSTDQDVTVNVVANAAPTIGAYATSSVALNGGTTVTPSAGPADHGTFSIAAASSTFAGGLSVNQSDGVVTVSNAAPAGAHTITVTISDSCNATTPVTFTLNVSCPAVSLGGSGMSFTAGGGAGTVGVTATAGCDWSSSSSASWVTFSTGSGTGNGTAAFTVAGNRTAGSRTANLTIGGQPFTVTQSTELTTTSVTAGVTVIRAVHFEELRIRVDRSRSQHGLSAFAWTDPNLAAGTPIRVVHMNELRTALVQAYAAASRTAPSFTDTPITTSTTIKALHFTELISAINALDGTQ